MKEGRQNHSCFLCCRKAALRCGACSVWFCCSAHGQLHRQEGELGCFPCRVVSRDNVGRCLVATRDVSAGEVLFAEDALAFGPSADSTNVCIVCSKTACSSCAECSFPLCPEGSKCVKTHQEYNECGVLQNVRREGKSLELVLPLRILLLKQQNPDSFAIAQSFMDHKDGRRSDVPHWERTWSAVMQPLHSALADAFSVAQVCTAIGIVEVNCCEVAKAARAIFPVTSLISHSCIPNAKIVPNWTHTTYSNVCVAARDISSGQEITITYVNVLQGSSVRREALKEAWYFECNCSRCEDSTECGTFLDAVRCLACDGHVLPAASGSWRCAECGESLARKEVGALVRSLEAERTTLDRANVQEHLDFIDKCAVRLHRTHYVINSVRRWIVPLMCKSGGSTDEMLKQKMDMAQDLLSVLDKIEPGLTKNRGRVLLELCDAESCLANRAFARGALSESDFTASLLRTAGRAQDAAKCVQFYAEGTYEAYVRQGAVKMASDINCLVEMIALSKGFEKLE